MGIKIGADVIQALYIGEQKIVKAYAEEDSEKSLAYSVWIRPIASPMDMYLVELHQVAHIT